MKIIPSLSAWAIGILACQLLIAQSPPPSPTRPADATGLCKDGTYSLDAVKKDACHGHHGIKEWYATATTPAASAPATPEVAPSPAAARTSAPPATAAAPSPTTQARSQSQAAAQRAGQSGEPLETQSINKDSAANTAPSVGPGMVWLRSGSKTYHCPGSRYYGKTKHGAYLSEADAKARGAHIGRGEVCTQ